MTADRYAPALSEAEAARVAAFDAAPTPPEVREAAVIEEVARAIYEADPDQTGGGEDIPWGAWTEGIRADYRRLAAAAVAAYRATRDGEAEEAVRRVCDELLEPDYKVQHYAAGVRDAVRRIRRALSERGAR